MREGVIVYNNFNDRFLLIKKNSSEYFKTIMSGKYRLGLLPIMIHKLLPEERTQLKQCIDGAQFSEVQPNSKHKMIPTLVNRLIKDKSVILANIDNSESHSDPMWELPSYACKTDTFDDILSLLSESIDYKIEDIEWRSINTIKKNVILITGDSITIKYHLVVINRDINNQNIKWTNSLHGILRNEVEDDIRKSIKNSMNNIVNVNPDKIGKGKYIRDYFGHGAYTLLDSGHIIVIINNVNENCEDIQFKLRNLSGIYGKYLTHHYLCYNGSTDLVILIR